VQEWDLHCRVVEDSHTWQELHLELLQGEIRTLEQLGYMLPAVEVHCWLGQHIHKPLLQGSPQQQQDSQPQDSHHWGHEGLLALL